MPPRALFLDFDGTIADSENHHIAAWQRTLRAMGRNAADDDCAKAAEIDDRAFLLGLQGLDANRLDVDGWLERKEALTLSLLADSPRIYPGVRCLVDRVASFGVPVAVVSTTRRENIETVVRAAGMESSIALIVGKQDSPAQKPDPAPYRVAIETLGILPEDGVAIEDSESGFLAASAAGLRTLIVGHRRPSGRWHGDAPYLPNFRNVDRVLDALGWPNR